MCRVARGACSDAWLIYLVDRLADAFLASEFSAISAATVLFAIKNSGWFDSCGLIDAEFSAAQSRRDHVRRKSEGLAAVYLAVNYAFNEVWEVVPLKEISRIFVFGRTLLL